MNTTENNRRRLEDDFPVPSLSNPGEGRQRMMTYPGAVCEPRYRVGRRSEVVNDRSTSDEAVGNSRAAVPHQTNATITTVEPIEDDLLIFQRQLRREERHNTSALPWLSRNFFVNIDEIDRLREFDRMPEGFLFYGGNNEEQDDERVHSYYPNSNVSVEQAFGDVDDDSVSDSTIGYSDNFPGYHRNPLDDASITLLDELSVITQESFLDDISQEEIIAVQETQETFLDDSRQEETMAAQETSDDDTSVSTEETLNDSDQEETVTDMPRMVVSVIDDRIDSNTPIMTPTFIPRQPLQEDTSSQNMPTATPLYRRALQDEELTGYLSKMCI